MENSTFSLSVIEEKIDIKSVMIIEFNQLDLIDNIKLPQYTFFSSIHFFQVYMERSPKVEHAVGHKASLSKF